jgi:hypothetical protein
LETALAGKKTGKGTTSPINAMPEERVDNCCPAALCGREIKRVPKLPFAVVRSGGSKNDAAVVSHSPS